jgi:NitT/TauT family transport system substrate-binding protein
MKLVVPYPPNKTLAWLMVFALLVFAGCEKKTGNETEAKQLTKIKLSLNWFPDSQHGGFYSAQLLGYYEQEGLDVEIVPGGPGAPITQQLILGRTDFAIVNADVVLESNARQADLVAVMAPLQDSPRCIMVHDSSGIRSFQQLNSPDVTLLIGSGKPYFEYLQKHIPLDKVATNRYDGKINTFLLDKKIAQQAYVFSEPFLAEQEGVKPYCLMVSDTGFNPYTSCVVTTQQRIDRDQETVQRFVRASIKGWQKYLDDPALTNAKISEINPRMDLESLQFGAQAMKHLCVPEGESAAIIGQMSDARWQQLHEQLVDLQRVPAKLDVKRSYSTAFLPAAPVAQTVP